MAASQSKKRSSARETRPERVSPSSAKRRAHIIGVNVSETMTETRIATATVTANSRNNRPTIPLIRNNGMNTAVSEIEIDMIVKPISPAPCRAACIGVFPLLDVPHDVLDHDDRIVDDKADSDRQRHQREVVQA